MTARKFHPLAPVALLLALNAAGAALVAIVRAVLNRDTKDNTKWQTPRSFE